MVAYIKFLDSSPVLTEVENRVGSAVYLVEASTEDMSIPVHAGQSQARTIDAIVFGSKVP